MPTVPRLPQRLRYRSIASSEDDDDEEEDDFVNRSSKENNDDSEDDDDEEKKEKKNTIEVIVLDFCQTRFTVLTTPTTTIADFKVQGYAVHNVPPNQQRLIYQGRMLNETSSSEGSSSSDANVTTDVKQQQKRLCDYGIQKNGTIIHLFPKPRVVVVPDPANAAATTTTSETDEEMANDNTTTSARIPTIILSNQEAEQRGQILVLGNLDYIEAVNNVKLFSFMLLIVSTIELLNLLSILMGDSSATTDSFANATTNNNHHNHPYLQPEDDDLFHDDILIPPTNNNNNNNHSFSYNSSDSHAFYPEDPAAAIYQTWTPLSWLDLIVSTFGVYVAVLGLRASNENRLSMARLYLIGVIITAIGWIGYNYMISVEVDEAVAASIHTSNHNNEGSKDDESDDEDVYGQAFQVMVLPAMIWCLCIFRAWQFQYLLSEAELEAAERIAQQQEADESEQHHHHHPAPPSQSSESSPNHGSNESHLTPTVRTTQSQSHWIGNGVLS